MSSRFVPFFFLLISSVSNAQIEDLSFGTPETFDIMTWNIEQFPKNGQTTVNYVSDIIQNLESDSKITFLPIGMDDPKVRRPDLTKLQSISDYRPQVNFKEGIRKTAEFFKSLES